MIYDLIHHYALQRGILLYLVALLFLVLLIVASPRSLIQSCLYVLILFFLDLLNMALLIYIDILLVFLYSPFLFAFYNSPFFFLSLIPSSAFKASSRCAYNFALHTFNAAAAAAAAVFLQLLLTSMNIYIFRGAIQKCILLFACTFTTSNPKMDSEYFMIENN